MTYHVDAAAAAVVAAAKDRCGRSLLSFPGLGLTTPFSSVGDWRNGEAEGYGLFQAGREKLQRCLIL